MTLRLMSAFGLPGFPGLIGIPAFETLSSLHISAQKLIFNPASSYRTRFQVRAETDDGFQQFYDASYISGLASDLVGVAHDSDAGTAFVRFEGRDLNPSRDFGAAGSPLPLFARAKVLEICVSFAGLPYRDFWSDLEKIGPQPHTLRLEVVEGMDSAVMESVNKFVEARLERGMPLAKLERMVFEGVSEEEEEGAAKLWGEFQAGLDVDYCLAAQ